jgi:GAF domain-containing protein
LGCSQKTVSRDVIELRKAQQWGVTQPVTNGDSQDGSPSPQVSRGAERSTEAVRVLAELDAELDANSKRTGRNMAWTAAERQLLSLVADHVDRQVELQTMYEACGQTRTKLAIATELRLVQSGIARLLKQIDADPAEDAPMSVRSRKAQKAAYSRWRPGYQPGVTGAG